MTRERKPKRGYTLETNAPEIVDLTCDDDNDDGDQPNPPPAKKPKTGKGKGAAAKKAIQEPWFNLFDKYRNEKEGPYRLRFIQSMEGAWIRNTLKKSLFVVVPRDRGATKGLLTKEVIYRVMLACHKCSVPYFRTKAFHRFVKILDREGLRPAAICLVNVRPEHLNEYNHLKDWALSKILPQSIQRVDECRVPVSEFCEKLVTAHGKTDLSKLDGSPIVVGCELVRQLTHDGNSRLVLVSFPFSEEDSMLVALLKDCYEKKVPFIWYPSKSNIGSLLRTRPVSAACITHGHDNYDADVQSLLDTVQRLFQAHDIQIFKALGIDQQESESLVRTIYDAVGVQFLSGPCMQLSVPDAYVRLSNNTKVTSDAVEGESGDQNLVDGTLLKEEVESERYRVLEQTVTSDNSATATNATLSVASEEMPDVVIPETSAGDQTASKPIRPTETREVRKQQRLWHSLFHRYMCLKGKSELLFVLVETDNGELLRWFKSGISFAVVLADQPKPFEQINRKINVVMNACKQYRTPFLRSDGTRFAVLLKKKDERRKKPIVAVLLRGVKSSHSSTFAELTELALRTCVLPLMGVQTTDTSYSEILHLCSKLVGANVQEAAAGTGSSATVEGSPIIVDLENVVARTQEGKSRLVFVSEQDFKAESGGEEPLYGLVKMCFQSKIPLVWFSDKEAIGLLFRTVPSPAVCITDGLDDDFTIQTLLAVVNKAIAGDQNNGGNLIADAEDPSGAGATGVSTDHDGSLGLEQESEQPAVGNERAYRRQEEKFQSIEEGTNVRLQLSENSAFANNANVASNFTVDADTIRLEESIALLEASVQAIRSRRLEVTEERQRTIESINELEGQFFQLENQQDELRLTVQKQKKLQQELQKTLEKSQYQLQRLLSPDVHFTQDEISQLAQIADREFEDTRSLESSDLESATGSRAELSTDMQGSPSWPTAATVRRADRLKLLWVTNVESSLRIGTFIPGLISKELVLSVLRVSAAEVLGTDSSVDGWKHRRQSMWNTCLDFRMIANRVSDDHMDEDEKKKKKADSTRKTSFDPNVLLCPYELSGECHDEFCAYQHLQERRFGRVLPRELLPLPDFTCMKTSSDPVNQARKKKRLEETSEPQLERNSPTVDKKMDVESDDLVDNVDFVSLPRAGTQEEEKMSTVDEDSSVHMASLKEGCDFWFSRSVLESSHGSTLFFSSLLRGMGCSFDDLSALKFEERELPRSRSEAAALVGRVVSGICLAVHAGRFDVTQQLLAFAESLCRNPDDIEEVFLSVFQIMQTLEMQSFTLDHGIFIGSFEIQCRGGLLCYFLRILSLFDDQTDLMRVKEQWDDIASIARQPLLSDDSNPVSSGKEIVDFIKSDVYPSRHIDSSGDDDESSKQVQDLKLVLDGVKQGRVLRRRVTGLKSIRLFIDTILPVCVRFFEHSVEESLRDPVGVLFKGIIIVSNALLGALESAATRIGLDANVEDNKNECMDLYHAIDKTLKVLQRVVSKLPSLELLLSPVFAANASLAATVKAYDKVQQRVESLVAGDGNRDIPSLLTLSELLWSQLIQLEASLPRPREESDERPDPSNQSRPFGLSSELLARHELLANNVAVREVHPHHVTLSNDWNLTDTLSRDFNETLFLSYQNILGALLAQPDNTSPFGFALTDRQLCRRETRGVPSAVYSTIPQSLLLAGPSLDFLELTKVGLDKLPRDFGSYFTALKRLDLSENNLEQVPESLFTISTLESLRLRTNKLSALPQKVNLPNLTLFDASYNSLKELPGEFARCTELQSLHLDGNPIEPSVWELASQFRHLLTFTYS